MTFIPSDQNDVSPASSSFLRTHVFSDNEALMNKTLSELWERGRQEVGEDAVSLFFSLLFQKPFLSPFHRALAFVKNEPKDVFDSAYAVTYFDDPYCFLFAEAEQIFRQNIYTLQERFFENTKTTKLDYTSSLLSLLLAVVVFRDYSSDFAVSIAKSERGYTFVFPTVCDFYDPAFSFSKNPKSQFLAEIVEELHLAGEVALPEETAIQNAFRGRFGNIVTLFLATSPESDDLFALSSLEKSILNFVFKKKEAKKKEIASYFALSDRSTALYLRKLCEQGFIKRTGSLHSPQQSYVLSEKVHSNPFF